MTTQLEKLIASKRTANANADEHQRINERNLAEQRRQELNTTLLTATCSIAELLGLPTDAAAITDGGELRGSTTLYGLPLNTIVHRDGWDRICIDFHLPCAAHPHAVRWHPYNTMPDIIQHLLDLIDEHNHQAALDAETQAAHDRRLNLAADLITLAHRYQADIHRTWDNACRAYAQHWTDQLWHPWEATTLRYTYIGDRNIADNTDYIQTALVSTPLQMITNVHVHTEITRRGERYRLAIGALVDARSNHFDKPSITSHLEYHVSLWIGNYYINIPPSEERRPDQPSPAQPIPWWDYLCTELPIGDLLNAYWYKNNCRLMPDDLLNRKPNEALHRYPECLPDPQSLT